MHKSTRASGIGDCVVVATAAENWQRSRRRAAAAACRQWLWQRSTGQRDDGCAGPPRPGSDGRRRAVRWRLRASEGGSATRPAQRAVSERPAQHWVRTLHSVQFFSFFSLAYVDSHFLTLYFVRDRFLSFLLVILLWLVICDLSLVFRGHLLLFG